MDSDIDPGILIRTAGMEEEGVPSEEDTETPTDTNPKTQYGNKKPSTFYIPPAAILQEGVAMKNGGIKYGPFNWRQNPVSASTYLEAMDRHMKQFLDGEDYSTDPKTGLRVHHLAAVRACCGIILDAKEHGTLIDDRPPFSGAATRMIERYELNGSFEVHPEPGQEDTYPGDEDAPRGGTEGTE